MPKASVKLLRKRDYTVEVLLLIYYRMSWVDKEYDELINARSIACKKLSQDNVIPPPGFTTELPPRKNTKTLKGTKNEDYRLEELKAKKAWEIAMSPAKSIPMNLIMSYMSGNSLQIITITLTFMLFWNPLKAIFIDTNRIFLSLETDKNRGHILMSKGLFVLFQLANMLIGIWKLYGMGLIPHTDSDWLSWTVNRPYSTKLMNNVVNRN